ncbi:MAG: fibronectin type III domain-containing protein [Gammaproteobacteria bacterium]|nr:fibronectin type III domain-containing protein [Gammaproteobacteria bacterium]
MTVSSVQAQVGTPETISVPDVPAALTVTAGNGSLTVSWAAPDDNGAPITDYDWCYRAVGAGFWIHEAPGTADSTATTAKFTGLINGTPYEIGVRAQNRVGESPWSDVVIGTPMPVPPAGPTGVTVTPGNGSLTVSWTAPDDNGAALMDYDLRYRAGAVGVWTEEAPGTAASTALRRELSGLANGTAYEVQVRAQNRVGESPWSDPATGTPVAPPAKPTGVTASAGNARVTLSWNDPLNNTITKYQVQQKTGAASYGDWMDIPNSSATTTSYEVTDLANGNEYGFRVRAVNAGGNGAGSDEVTVTPLAPPSVLGSLADVTLVVAGPPAIVDAAAVFAGRELEYTVSVDNTNVAGAQADAGGSLTVSAVREGRAQVTVTARNASGEASVSFGVRVETSAAEVSVLKDVLGSQARMMLNSVTDVIGARFGDGSDDRAAGSVTEMALGVLSQWAGAATGRELGGSGAAYPWAAGIAPASPLGAVGTTISGGLGSALAGRSFKLALEGDVEDGQSAGPGLTVWGAADYQQFDSDKSSASLDGELATFYLGADTGIGEHLLAGVALSRADGETDYRFAASDVQGGGRLDTEMTTVYPYARLQLDSGLEVWGLAGVGTGEAVNRRDHVAGLREKTDLSLLLGTVGMRQSLRARGGVELSLVGDAGHARLKTDDGLPADLSATASHMRLGAEGRFVLGESARSWIRLGGRLDGGDRTSNGGAEFAGGLSFEQGRFRGNLTGRYLLGSGDYDEAGVSGLLSLQSKPGGIGFSFELEPGYGMAEVGQFGLWGGQQMQSLAQRPAHRAPLVARMGSRVAYGIALRRDRLLTPFSEYSMTSGSAGQMRLGVRLQSDWKLELMALRQARALGEAPDYRAELRFTFLDW